MKKILFLIALILSITSLVSADVLSTNSDYTFDATKVKEINIMMPANCSAMNGELVLTNCTLVSITESFNTKTVETNGNKFILYGMNKDIMQGFNLKVIVQPIGNQKVIVGIINSVGATPDAQEIVIDDFGLELTSFLDINADGLLNGDDVAIMIDSVFDNNATIVDLQKIINAVIEEMQ